MSTHLSFFGRCEILEDICYHNTTYCMIFVCVLQQMAEEPNCRNTEAHRAWQCCEGFLSLLTSNLWAAAERGRAKGQQRSPKQLVNAPSSPSQESKGHSSKSIMMIIDCHSFRHWCVLLPPLQLQPAAGRHQPAGMGPGARWRGPRDLQHFSDQREST